MRHFRPGAALSFIAVLLASASVSAQSSTGELTDERLDHRVAAELGFNYSSEMSADIGILAPALYGTFTVAKLGDTGIVQIDGAWRFTGVFGDVSAFRAGNPYFGARIGMHRVDETSQLRIRGGVGLTVPVSNLYDDYTLVPSGDSVVAFLVGPGMHGLYDAWLFTAFNMAAVFRADLEYRSDYFAVGGDAGLGLLFPVTYEGDTGDTVVLVQLAAWAAGRPIPELAIGGRFQAVGGPDSVLLLVLPDEGYLSLIPFVRAELDPAFVEMRLMMNLDEPYGFAFDSGTLKIWAIQLLGGASF